MQLKVSGKHLDTRPLHGVLTQGEKNANNPTITMPRNYDGVDISSLDYEMQAYSTKDTLVMYPLTKQVTDTEIALTWKITEEFTAVAGPIWFVIVGTDANNEQIIIITADEVVVRQAPQGRWQPPPPDLLASTLAQMITIKATAMQYATDAAAAAKQSENAAARAEAASAAMPYVGDDGYWYTWDNNTGQFVKTDIPKKHSHPMSEVTDLESTIAHKANGNPITGDALDAERLSGFIKGAQVASALNKSSYLIVGRQEGVPSDLRLQHQHIVDNGRGIFQIYLSGVIDGVTDRGFYVDFADGISGSSAKIFAETTPLIPKIDNSLDVGSAARRYRQIYAANATINTSDKRQKTDISPIPNPIAFIMALEPVQYKMAYGTSGRTHYGLLAQRVKDAMDRVGLTDKDFAGWIASPVLDDDNKPTSEYIYGLRYEEFIAPLIATVQEQQKQIQALQDRLR